MNKAGETRLPGFTAEASLYTKREAHRMTATLDASAGEQKVVPQVRGGWGCFLNCCIWGNDPADCARGCGIMV